MPRSRSSGALSIWSYAVNVAPPVFARILVIAAVSDVLPWSTWPIVPMLQCGLFRSNFAFVMVSSLLKSKLLTGQLGDDFVRHRLRDRRVVIEGHRVGRTSLGHRPQCVHVAEHVGERDHRIDHLRVAAGLHALDLAAAAVQVAD